jgi:hypothetical protein
MAADPKKRQKKLERRAAKRKAKQHDLVREKSAGLPERLEAAVRSPVLHSWATEAVWDQGLGWVVLSRQLPNGSVACGVFLVDRYCLGVKNAFGKILSRQEYDSSIFRKMHSEYASRDLSPAAARKLVEAAVEYARSLGLPPHPDYHVAKLIFGSIDPAECTEEFEFGQDGKPLFVAGPYDTPERSQQILNALERSCGPGGYHYTIPFAGSTPILPGGQVIQMLGPDEEMDDDFDEEDMS